MSKRNRKIEKNPARIAYDDGCALVSAHPIFGPLYRKASVRIDDARQNVRSDGFVAVTVGGHIWTNVTHRLEPGQWSYVIAHSLLHFALGHFSGPQGPEWNLVCDVAASRFLADIKFGTPPVGVGLNDELSRRLPATEEKMFAQLPRLPAPDLAMMRACSLGGSCAESMIGRYSDIPKSLFGGRSAAEWEKIFGDALAAGVQAAIEVAGNRRSTMNAEPHEGSTASPGRIAKEWFMANFPLLGALAAGFQVIESPDVARALDIRVAAVSPRRKEIYINPGAGLSAEELKFVMAHELLHVGLRHDVRSLGRDHYLWNVACDYVINQWLLEMKVGQIPQMGLLLDDTVRGQSAESIYDKITGDLRLYRRLQTLRGVGESDIIDDSSPAWWNSVEGVSLDEFYRRTLAQGMELQMSGTRSARGHLPAGLIEEIRGLLLPPVPWDVKLGKWFNENFRPLEQRKTFARVSRRQCSTPDIPRSAWYTPEELKQGHTFAVVIDTSGSMFASKAPNEVRDSKKLIAKALGAIAGYAFAHDVEKVRLIYCDAAPYDVGYIEAGRLLERVEVVGKGGTVLQPAIDLVESAKDFPPDGPILIITDGICDSLLVKRSHAYLVPPGARLPFHPKGPVFEIPPDKEQ